jgi:hypothetical protein
MCIDYYALTDYFKTNKFDTVICDSFLDTCRHAAMAADIPFIITCTLGLTPGKCRNKRPSNIFSGY